MSLTSYRAAPPRGNEVTAPTDDAALGIAGVGEGVLEDLAATYSPTS